MTTTAQPINANQPVAELRDGTIKVAIFRNLPKQEGDPVRFSGRLTRSYRDANGDWQETNSLSGSEYLRTANLLIQAYNRDLELKAAEKAAANEDPE